MISSRSMGRALAARVGALCAAGVIVLGVGVSAAGAASDTLPVLNLTMTGKSIQASGSMVSGAVNVAVDVTTGSAGPVLVRLDDGVSIGQAFGAVGQAHGDPNGLDGFAKIQMAASVHKGTTSIETMLQPGNYVALDTSHGNNPANWPRTAFTVTAAPAPASLPKPAATVAAIEFGFTGPSVLHEGSLVRFEDNGFLVHMIVAIKVAKAADAGKVEALLRAGQDRKAQKLATGFATFMSPASPGALQQQTITASPGTYVLVCFMDTQDGREHTQLGMEKTITIVK